MLLTDHLGKRLRPVAAVQGLTHVVTLDATADARNCRSPVGARLDAHDHAATVTRSSAAFVSSCMASIAFAPVYVRCNEYTATPETSITTPNSW